jgi:hypothetical protein
MTTSAPYWRIHSLALLAEAYDIGERAEEGLPVLAEALKRATDTRTGFYEPEIQ